MSSLRSIGTEGSSVFSYKKNKTEAKKLLCRVCFEDTELHLYR